MTLRSNRRFPARRALTLTLVASAALALIAACGGATAELTPTAEPAPAAEPTPAAALTPTEFPVVTHGDMTLQFGDRVRLVRRAGTFKPQDTRHTAEVAAGPGQTGVVLGGERRRATTYFTPDPDEPIQIVRVRWDEQAWDSYGPEAGPGSIRLAPFEATVHVTYVEPVR